MQAVGCLSPQCLLQKEVILGHEASHLSNACYHTAIHCSEFRASVRGAWLLLCQSGQLTSVVIASGQVLLSLSVANCGFRSQILPGLSPKSPNLL